MKDYKNILVVRTDRVGDVVLTTPAIAALRSAFPAARISILVAPETRDIVDGNPNLNEVLIDDRKGAHKGAPGFFALVSSLRQKKFDLAVIFHTKKRTNLLCSFAGIPARLGYKNDKFGFLLTLPIEDTRAQGSKHEAEYCLDVLKAIGVSPLPLKLDMPVKPEWEAKTADVLKKSGILESDTLVAVHPGASCISKRWAPERFAAVIDSLVSASVKVVLIGGAETLKIAEEIRYSVKNPILDLTGKTTIGELAALLKHCHLLISNDSGPVHVAVAVGTPVVSIFGRNQKGLSPARWKPLGAKDIVLHEEVGCVICLAHNCDIDFKCLKAVTIPQVLEAAKTLL